MSPTGADATAAAPDRVEPDGASAPPSSLARVFISYAREDLEFVRRMSDLLEAAGRDVWVDLDEIPSSAEWQHEIDGGIDAADVVVVVLSPDWVDSGPCRAELQRAVDGGKRLLPMVRRAVDPERVPPELAALQWLSCEGDVQAEDVLGALSATLDMDLAWVKAHTRLLVKAIEWESNAEDRALLVRGGDLTNAEAALAAHADDQPAPTPLQRRYVASSREAAVRSARIRFGAVTVALVVSIALTVVAFFERSQAQHQTTIATERALSADSVAEQTRDPELSLLLALEAVKRSDTGESERALRQALEDSQLEATFRLPKPFRAATFSPTGRGLALASDDGVRLRPDWGDPKTKEHFLSTGPANDAEWSPDGTQLVTAGVDGKARVWDAQTFKQRLALPADAVGGVSTAVFSADGTRILTAGIDGTARIWDAASGSQQVVLGVHPNCQPSEPTDCVVSSAAFSRDGTRVVTAGWDGTAQIWDVTNGSQLLVIRPNGGVPDYIYGASFSPDGKNVVTTEEKVATIYDANDGHLVRSLVGHTSGQVYTAQYSSFGDHIVTAASDSTARVWDAGTGDLLSTLYGHTDQVDRAAYSADASLIATASADGTARVWRADPNGESLRVFPGNSVRLASAALSPNGQQIATGKWDGSALLWNVDARTPTGKTPIALQGHTGPVFWVTFSPNNKTVATSSIDGSVRLYDTRTGNQEGVLAIARDLVVGGTTAVVDFSPDGRYLAGASGTIVYVWDLQHQGKLVAVWQPSKDPNYVIHKIVFGPGGKTVMTADHFGNAVVWNWRLNGRIVRTIHADFGDLYSATFSKDGRRIVTSGADGTAKTWDARTGKSLVVLRGHLGVVFDSAFSPDGTRVVTAGADGTARLWDALHGGDALVVFSGHTDLLASAGFNPQGTKILTSSADGTARMFACDLCGSIRDLVKLAENRATRGLTAEERRRYGL